jgi:CRP-like cAMP-binding protein
MEGTVQHEGAGRLEWPSVDALRGERRFVPKNAALVRAGEFGIRVRVISSGWAFRYRTLEDGRRQILNVLLPGDIFGLETMFGHLVETSIQTSTPLVYTALHPNDLIQSLESSSELRRHFVSLVLIEKASLEEWMVRLGKCDAEERTVSLLISLHARLLRAGLASSHGFDLELTQQEMADILGLHVIHLNRVLSRLRARKLVTINGKHVTLLDMPGLIELVPPLSHSNVPAPAV